jgi:hypothetical protein
MPQQIYTQIYALGNAYDIFNLFYYFSFDITKKSTKKLLSRFNIHARRVSEHKSEILESWAFFAWINSWIFEPSLAFANIFNNAHSLFFMTIFMRSLKCHLIIIIVIILSLYIVICLVLSRMDAISIFLKCGTQW